MKKLKILGAVVIILSAATVLYLVKPMGAQGTDSQTCNQGSTPNSCVVTITPSADPDGTPTVDPGNQHIWRDKDQTVEWSCPTEGCTFDVTFTETKKPFENRIFNNSHAGSGHITGGPDKYKYSVIVNGTQVKDPQIIVH
jgi:hypothetical protein